MKQLLVFFLLTIASHSFAQQITVKETGELKTATGADMTHYKEHAFVVESRIKARFGFSAKLDAVKQAYNIKVFSMQGKLVAEKKLANGEHLFGPVDPVFRIINDSLYLLYARYEQEVINIFASKLNTSTLELAGEQKVLTIPHANISLSIFSTSFQFYSLGIASSPDKNKTAFFWCNGDNTDFYYSVIDQSFAVVSSGNGTVAGLKRMKLDNMFISNNGGFYAGVTFEYYDGGAVIVCKQAAPAIVVPIKLNNANAGSVYLSEMLEGNQLNLAGVVLKDNLITGVYKAALDLTANTIAAVVETDFPAAIIEKGSKEDFGFSRKNKYGLNPSIKMKGYTLPGGTIIIAGDLWRDATTNMNIPRRVKGPLITSCFKKQGDPELTYIPKIEITREQSQNSFYGHIYKGELLLLYVDAVENIGQSLSTASTLGTRSSADRANVCMKMNGNGIVDRKIFAYFKKGNAAIYDFNQIIPLGDKLLFGGLETRRYEYSDYKMEQSLMLINITD